MQQGRECRKQFGTHVFSVIISPLINSSWPEGPRIGLRIAHLPERFNIYKVSGIKSLVPMRSVEADILHYNAPLRDIMVRRSQTFSSSTFKVKAYMTFSFHRLLWRNETVGNGQDEHKTRFKILFVQKQYAFLSWSFTLFLFPSHQIAPIKTSLKVWHKYTYVFNAEAIRRLLQKPFNALRDDEVVFTISRTMPTRQDIKICCYSMLERLHPFVPYTSGFFISCISLHVFMGKIKGATCSFPQNVQI